MKSQASKTNIRLLPPTLRRGRNDARRKQGKTVFVAMSGGVDSSVAAALLIERGFDVVGCHMKCFNVDGCAERDAEDARRVAEQLGIPFYVFDFEKEYKHRVVDYMIKGYKTGITPNPDVMCNKEIKFGLFFEKARALGADYVATGHYVQLRPHRHPDSPAGEEGSLGRDSSADGGRLQNDNAAYHLCAAKDANKDQSYFLWTLTQSQLAYCLFPIGEYTKPQVRVLAKKFGLLTASKKDSQGICFLGQVSIRDFLRQYIKPKKGDVLLAPSVIPATMSFRPPSRNPGPQYWIPAFAGMPCQRVVGTHEGAHLYTIGQRHGFGVGGLKAPHYVVAKDMKKNTITIAPENHPALYKKEVTLTDVNFTRPSQLSIVKSQLSVFARVRYRQPLFPAILSFAHSRELGYKKNGEWRLVFQKPQKFVAEGQSAVFYVREGNPSRGSGCRSRELRMLGGGIIVA